MINVFQPSLGADELQAVGEVFASNWIGKGRKTEQFESAFAAHLGIARSLIRTTTCCTEALFQSMSLLGIGPGDEVVLPTISFVGAGNAVAACGATPVFCDVDPRSLNATPETVETCMTTRTKALIVLHYGGLPCAIEQLRSLTAGRNVALIEDSACSVASKVNGRSCGTFGDIGAWSFDAMKILVTGDGGMIYCRDDELALQAEHQFYLGLVTKSGYASKADSKWWEFEIDGFGRRAIINDVASAIGVVQLARLEGFIARRRAVHQAYERLLADVSWLQRPPAVPNNAQSSYYFYWIQTAPELRDRVASHLRERQIYSTFRYYPLHQVAHYRATGAVLPNAELAAISTLCLPIHQALTDDDIDQVVDAIRSFEPGT